MAFLLSQSKIFFSKGDAHLQAINGLKGAQTQEKEALASALTGKSFDSQMISGSQSQGNQGNQEDALYVLVQ